jgi:hypothetical protein
VKQIRNIVLEDEETAIVQRVAADKHYGQRGFSQALRDIIREWAQLDRVVTIKPIIKVTPETVASMGVVDGPINSTSVIHYTIHPEDSNG